MVKLEDIRGEEGAVKRIVFKKEQKKKMELIQITDGQKQYLDRLKVHPEETYADVMSRVLVVIERFVEIYDKTRSNTP